MQSETRYILDRIDEALVKGDSVAQELWDVLSALRGPDFEDRYEGMKMVTTVPIRVAAFPHTAAESQHADSQRCDPNNQFKQDKRPIKNAFFGLGLGSSEAFLPGFPTPDAPDFHFNTHVLAAGRVLNLVVGPRYDSSPNYRAMNGMNGVSGYYDPVLGFPPSAMQGKKKT